MWHIHRFTEQERIYSGHVKFKGPCEVAGANFERIVMGVTTIVSKCCVCGKVQTVEVLGDARRPTP